MTRINPKKYNDRFKDMSSDIFSDNMLIYSRSKKSIDRESLKQSDLAGNYKEAPSYEFNDVVNIKYYLK